MSKLTTRLEIDSKALKHNLNYFKQNLNPSTKIAAVIKANGYGCGIELIAKLLTEQNIAYLAVTSAKEGMRLRRFNIKANILVLFPQVEDLEDIIGHNLEPMLYSFRILNRLEQLLQKQNITEFPAHIKINSGMNRLGFQPSEAQTLGDQLKNNNQLKIHSICTHFSASDDPNELQFSQNQIDLFNQTYSQLTNALGYSPIKHASNTAGAVLLDQYQFDMVRIGLGLFGLTHDEEADKNLMLVPHLKSRIAQIQTLEKGDSLGYNRAFKALSKTRIGIIPVGYADGFRRGLSHGLFSVKINGQPAPVAGLVCMDITMIDLSNISCDEGDEVIIFNHQADVKAMASALNTVPYEVLTGISARVTRAVI